MQSPLFFRCLAFSVAAHSLVFAVGVGFLRKVPATASIDAQLVKGALSALIVNESETANLTSALTPPAPEQSSAQGESQAEKAPPIVLESVKASPKKIHRPKPNTLKEQSKNSPTSAAPTNEPDADRTIVEGAGAGDQGFSLIQASPGYDRNPRPKYPESARRGGREGVVRLIVVVDPTGTPTSVTVSASSGFEALDESAVAAVKEWTFKPGSINGVAVASQVEVPIRFSLKDANSAKR